MTVPSPLIRNKRVVSRRTASPAPGRHDDRRAGDDDDNDDEQMDMGRHHDDVARARGSDGTPAPRSPTTDKLVNKTSPVSLSRATAGTASTVRATGNAAKPTPQTSFERGYRVDAAEDDEDDEMEDVEDVGDAEDAEDVASPAEDVTMRRTDGDVVKRDRRSERQREPDREEEEEEEDQRPSLPGIKQLFGIAGGASTANDSSRASTPSFPGLSSLHDPLMSRSSVSSDVSGRLSRLSSFTSVISGIGGGGGGGGGSSVGDRERESFSTSISSAPPLHSPGIWWAHRGGDDFKDGYAGSSSGSSTTNTPAVEDQPLDISRKGSYAAFASSIVARGGGGGPGRGRGEYGGSHSEAVDRRWSDMPGGPPYHHARDQHHQDELARMSRFQSYPFSASPSSSRVHTPAPAWSVSSTANRPPPISPPSRRQPNNSNNSNSPLKWSSAMPGSEADQRQPKPLTPVSPTTWTSGGPPRDVPQPPPGRASNDRAGAPAFVSPFGDGRGGSPSVAATATAPLHHPQPMQVSRAIPSPGISYGGPPGSANDANDRERAHRRESHARDPLSPQSEHPTGPPYAVQRSRSGPAHLLGDQQNATRRTSSSGWRSHPYERERQGGDVYQQRSSLSRQRSRSPGGPIMGPYAEQARRGSVQIAPDMLQSGAAYHWKGVPPQEPFVKMEDHPPMGGPPSDGRWSSTVPPRAAERDHRRSGHVVDHHRVSPRSGARHLAEDVPAESPASAFEQDMQDSRRKSDTEMRWRDSPTHHSRDPRGWDSRPSSGPVGGRSHDSMPSVLRPAPPPHSVSQPTMRPVSVGPGQAKYSGGEYEAQLPPRTSDRVGQYQPIRVYPANGMPTAELPRPISSNENGPQGPGEHGTIVNGPNGPRYICNFCGKTFTRPSSLRIHTYSHTGERPYVCNWPNCGRSFSVQSNLKRHAKTHTLAQSSSTVTGVPDASRLELPRRNTYDVGPSSRDHAVYSTHPYAQPVPHRPGQGQSGGRMSLGSLMDDSHGGRRTRQTLKQPPAQVKLDEEEEEEDELADDGDEEVVTPV